MEANQKLQELKQEIVAHRAACKEKGLKGRMAGFPDQLRKKTVELQKELAPELKKSAFLKSLGLAFTVFSGWDGDKPKKPRSPKKLSKKASKMVKEKAPTQRKPRGTAKLKEVAEIADSAVVVRVLKKKAQMEKLLLEIEKDLDSNIKVLEKLKAQPKIKI